jgi:hypothetical protein
MSADDDNVALFIVVWSVVGAFCLCCGIIGTCSYYDESEDFGGIAPDQIT